MNLRYFLFALLSVALTKPVGSAKVHIIGSRGYGFFSEILTIINNLDWCEKNNAKPFIFWNAGNYVNAREENAWEYFFYQLSEINISNIESQSSWRNFYDPSGNILIPYGPCRNIDLFRARAAFLCKKYIKILPRMQELVDKFFNENMFNKITVGLHLRGTDKSMDVRPVDPELICKEANRCAKILKGESKFPIQFLVATDQEKLLQIAKKKLMYPVIHTDAKRSLNDNPVHYVRSKRQLGEDVLLDALLLSKCGLLIHTCSNVSDGALIFNPGLPHLDLMQR